MSARSRNDVELQRAHRLSLRCRSFAYKTPLDPAPDEFSDLDQPDAADVKKRPSQLTPDERIRRKEQPRQSPKMKSQFKLLDMKKHPQGRQVSLPENLMSIIPFALVRLNDRLS